MTADQLLARVRSAAARSDLLRAVASVRSDGGLRLALLPKSTRGVRVQASLTLRFGDETTLAGQAAVSQSTEALLMRGTGTKGSFDWRCCQCLKIDYTALETETLKGEKNDAELLAWSFQHGRQPDDQEIEV